MAKATKETRITIELSEDEAQGLCNVLDNTYESRLKATKLEGVQDALKGLGFSLKNSEFEIAPDGG